MLCIHFLAFFILGDFAAAFDVVVAVKATVAEEWTQRGWCFRYWRSCWKASNAVNLFLKVVRWVNFPFWLKREASTEPTRAALDKRKAKIVLATYAASVLIALGLAAVSVIVEGAVAVWAVVAVETRELARYWANSFAVLFGLKTVAHASELKLANSSVVQVAVEPGDWGTRLNQMDWLPQSSYWEAWIAQTESPSAGHSSKR
jgi:hypothetical protein